jgi:predicted anti-sigma-YlaC factor YlaD
MTKRLQVLIEEDELAEIRRAARRRRQSVAEWVRSALRQARTADAGHQATEKLRVIRAAIRHEYPTGSIEEVLSEIEQGYEGSMSP